MPDNNELYLSCYSRLGKDKPNRSLDTINIYLSYNKIDQSKIEEVKEKILKRMDVNIYYLDYQKYEKFNFEDLKVLLKEMDLAVFIITNNYLENEENSYLVEYPYFIDNTTHIAPIMMESVSIDKYEEKFQTTQFINFEEQDLSKISFENKISNLITNEDVKGKKSDIEEYASRDTFFNKKIFVSYRKVDRKYAQLISSYIHKEYDNLNIRIWFDDFLVPGEEFDEAIFHELEAADIFLLLVTPNILDGDNYVKTIEYKKAVEEKKTIFPVLMEDTDINKLKKDFPNIPELIRIEELNEKIISFFKGRDELKDSDTERLHALAIAYLEGIQVERNINIGSKLLLEAAKNNLEAKSDYLYLFLGSWGFPKDYHKFIELGESYLLELEPLLNYQEFTLVDRLYIDISFSVISTYSDLDIIPRNQVTKFIEVVNKFNGLKDGYYYPIYYDIQNLKIKAASFVFGQQISADHKEIEALFKDAEELYNYDKKYRSTYIVMYINYYVYNSLINQADIRIHSNKLLNLLIEELEEDPLNNFQSVSQWSNLISSYIAKEDIINFFDRAINLLSDAAKYDPSIEKHILMLFISKLSELLAYDANKFFSYKDEFLKRYKNIDVVQLDYEDRNLYYLKATAILVQYSEPEKAIELAKEGLSNLSFVHDVIKLRLLSSIISAYRDMGEEKEALPYINKLLEIKDGVEDQEETKSVIYVIADIIADNYLNNDRVDEAKNLIDELKEFVISNYQSPTSPLYKTITAQWDALIKSLASYSLKIDNLDYLNDNVMDLNSLIEKENYDDIDKKMADNAIFFNLVLAAIYDKESLNNFFKVIKGLWIESVKNDIDKISSKSTATILFNQIYFLLDIYQFDLEYYSFAFVSSIKLIRVLGIDAIYSTSFDKYLKTTFLLANYYYSNKMTKPEMVTRIFKNFSESMHYLVSTSTTKVDFKKDEMFYYLLALAFLIIKYKDQRASSLFFNDLAKNTNPINTLIIISGLFLKEIKQYLDIRVELYTSLVALDAYYYLSNGSPYADICYSTLDYVKNGLYEEAYYFHKRLLSLFEADLINQWKSRFKNDLPIYYDLFNKYLMFDSVILKLDNQEIDRYISAYLNNGVDWNLVELKIPIDSNRYNIKTYHLSTNAVDDCYLDKLKKTKRGLEVIKYAAKNELIKARRTLLELYIPKEQLLKIALQMYMSSIISLIKNDQGEIDYKLYLEELLKYVEVINYLVSRYQDLEAPIIYLLIYGPLIAHCYNKLQEYEKGAEYALNFISKWRNHPNLDQRIYSYLGDSYIALKYPKEEIAKVYLEALKVHHYFTKNRTQTDSLDLSLIYAKLTIYDQKNINYYSSRITILNTPKDDKDISNHLRAYNQVIEYEIDNSNLEIALSTALDKLNFINHYLSLDNNKLELKKTYEQLSHIYKLLGDDDKSYSYYLLMEKIS